MSDLTVHDEVEFISSNSGVHKWGRIYSIDSQSGMMLVTPNAENSGLFYPVHKDEVKSYKHNYEYKYT